MTTSSQASSAPAGKVIASLVKDYQAIVQGNEEGARAFIRKAHRTNSRDLLATLTEARKSGAVAGIKPAYALYFGLANTCLELSGAESVLVEDFMKVVAVSQRTLKKDGALALVARVSSWDDFEAKTREAEALKSAGKPEGKGKKGASAKAEGEITASSIVSMALGLLQELDEHTLDTPEAIAQAEILGKLLASAVKFSKGELAKSKSAHPVNA